MKRRSWLRALGLGLALGFLGACACGTPANAAWTQETLYFGLSKPGGTVSAQEWQDFVDKEVTPRFPDGLTQWPAQGQWTEAGKPLLKEESRVLQILHPASAEADAKIQAIREAYKKEFSQSSVLRVRAPVRAEF